MSDRVSSLVTRYFAVSGGELLVGGMPIGVLAERHGTPLYVYDAQVLERKW